MRTRVGLVLAALLAPAPAWAVSAAGPDAPQHSAPVAEAVAPALYAVQFVGMAGGGRGSLYVGHGIVSGVDITGGTYDGSYVVNEGRIHGIAALRALGDSRLVTGQGVGDGQRVEIRFELPVAVDETVTYAITVGAQPVYIQLRKVRDLP